MHTHTHTQRYKTACLEKDNPISGPQYVNTCLYVRPCPQRRRVSECELVCSCVFVGVRVQEEENSVHNNIVLYDERVQRLQPMCIFKRLCVIVLSYLNWDIII